MVQILPYLKQESNTASAPHRLDKLSNCPAEVAIRRVLPFNENIIFLSEFHKDLCQAPFSIFRLSSLNLPQ